MLLSFQSFVKIGSVTAILQFPTFYFLFGKEIEALDVLRIGDYEFHEQLWHFT
jgi:hypothetical protein